MMTLKTVNAVPNKVDRHAIRSGIANGIVIAAGLVVGCLLVWLILRNGGETPGRNQADETASELELAKPNRKKAFPVTIRTPAGPPRVFTGLTDAHGEAVTVSCSTCHATRSPNFENTVVADLDEFHGGLKFSHGQVSCLSCHNSNDYDALKLADGKRVEFTEVMTLCAQCHGPQMKDYEHGTHGGMNGYWDRSRGPQTKNNCVDCHNPHAPQFPKMQPTFKPRDRFLNAEGKH